MRFVHFGGRFLPLPGVQALWPAIIVHDREDNDELSTKAKLLNLVETRQPCGSLAGGVCETDIFRHHQATRGLLDVEPGLMPCSTQRQVKRCLTGLR